MKRYFITTRWIRHFFSRIWPRLSLAFVFLFFLAGVLYGQDKERKFPDYYPDKFTTIGNLDRVTEDEIVIGDILYKLSPSATYHTPTNRDASKLLFSVGSRLGVQTNPKHEVTSLWLIQ